MNAEKFPIRCKWFSIFHATNNRLQQHETVQIAKQHLHYSQNKCGNKTVPFRFQFQGITNWNRVSTVSHQLRTSSWKHHVNVIRVHKRTHTRICTNKQIVWRQSVQRNNVISTKLMISFCMSNGKRLQNKSDPYHGVRFKECIRIESIEDWFLLLFSIRYDGWVNGSKGRTNTQKMSTKRIEHKQNQNWHSTEARWMSDTALQGYVFRL